MKYGVMLNEETTEEKAEVGRMELEHRNELEVTEPEADLQSWTKSLRTNDVIMEFEQNTF